MKSLSIEEFLTLRDQILSVQHVESLGFGRSDLSRKDFAASVRKLFKSLGIKGISVTAPNYSMAQAIEIRIPSVDHFGYLFSARQYDEIYDAKADIQDRINWIMDHAYPNHGSRSDVFSDYFDYKYSVH